MSGVLKRSRLAVRAAVSVAEEVGYAAHGHHVLADSNHTIVWLRPHEIVAKVGRRSADELLLREHQVASVLREAGAPIAPPLPDVEPMRERQTGLLVTLWRRLEHGDEDDADAADIGRSLQSVHETLDLYPGELPSFRQKLESARALLDDDAEMSALDSDDRRLLRSTFDVLLDQLASHPYRSRRLHGEPHGQNRLTTPHGVRWIDFEGACQGPIEWDLAFLPERARAAFPPPDEALLQLLRKLNSARTATLCWARYEVPALRWHARFHLQQLQGPVRGL